LGGNANITCHSQLETDAHGVFFKHANDRLRTTLRCGDIPCKVGHSVTLDLRERLHIAARGVHAVFPADYDDAHVRILGKSLHEGGNLTAPTIGNGIQRRPVEPEKANFPFRVDFIMKTVEIAQNCSALFRVIFGHEAAFTMIFPPSNALFCSTCAKICRAKQLDRCFWMESLPRRLAMPPGLSLIRLTLTSLCSSLRRLRESRQRLMRNPYIDRYGLKASREPAARPVRASPSKSASRNTVFPECRTRIAAHDASRRRAAPR